MNVTGTAFGRPVEGSVEYYSDPPVQQDDPQRFIEALDDLLDTRGVLAVVWEQYTPYFNDGDACVFGVHEARIKVEGNPDDGEYEDGFLGKYDMYEYAEPYSSSHYKVWREYNGVSGKTLAEALDKFNNVLAGGQHDVVLLDQFGDPAQVTATKEGFVVESYDHD